MRKLFDSIRRVLSRRKTDKRRKNDNSIYPMF